MENELVYKDLSYMDVLRNYSFESKMLACQKYASRIMDISEVSMSLAYRENIMPWELESFTMFAILYNDDTSTEPLTSDVFANVITVLRNYWHHQLTIAEQNGTYSEDFFMISAIQQFPVQGLILQKLFRYAYIFDFENERVSFKQVFHDTFSTEYKSFDKAAFAVYVSSCNGTGISESQRSRLMQSALSDKNVMNALQIDKEVY